MTRRTVERLPQFCEICGRPLISARVRRTGRCGAHPRQPALPEANGTAYRLIMAAAAILCGVAAAAGIWPAVDRVVSAVVVGVFVGVAVAGCVAVVRRELRIRRRLAAIQPLGATDRPRQRVGVPR
ncbi:hypothetical protein PHY01_51640 [Pseudonocardia hydrocarbonoxydans]|uniref:Uncharacterized protein n=1 Tax=Pseudonocardia hydrocarbonoxydans TaxID=76726 RepID=A0A4Y3WX92_9PSEU|nr:hypothetical protein [Pseudonocardia hydrocarbonoxydans]GEC22881.1 hypothetical protein PHY01_51640 [Pseudonocardia hydrocarbonoxydans]